jgi:aspartate/methionine/tyrosine aminotransferase
MQPRDLEHPDACDFLAGNPQELASQAYVEAVQRAVVPDSPSYFAYGPPWQPAVRAVTAALAERLGVELEAEDVFLTRGASSGLGTALRALIDPGDEVVLMSPPWFFYESMVLGVGAEPVKVPLAGDNFDLDPDAIRQAITPRRRAVIVNTPHNPSGRIYIRRSSCASSPRLSSGPPRGSTGGSTCSATRPTPASCSSSAA